MSDSESMNTGDCNQHNKAGTDSTGLEKSNDNMIWCQTEMIKVEIENVWLILTGKLKNETLQPNIL